MTKKKYQRYSAEFKCLALRRASDDWLAMVSFQVRMISYDVLQLDRTLTKLES